MLDIDALVSNGCRSESSDAAYGRDSSNMKDKARRTNVLTRLSSSSASSLRRFNNARAKRGNRAWNAPERLKWRRAIAAQSKLYRSQRIVDVAEFATRTKTKKRDFEVCGCAHGAAARLNVLNIAAYARLTTCGLVWTESPRRHGS